MSSTDWPTVLIVAILSASALWASGASFEYPSAVLEAYDADASCWKGMDTWGSFPVAVVPEQWLVGPPPSGLSAVTLLEDHWVHIAFSGAIVNADGNDILIEEPGRAGEQALVFLTDGLDQEVLLGMASAEAVGGQDLSHIEIELGDLSLPFVPRALRIVAVDKGGGLPGFDLANVRARVSHECGERACCPNPVSGARGIAPDVELSFSPAASTGSHVVHLARKPSCIGSDDTVVQPSRQPRDANCFRAAGLQLGKTYYWRVDEVSQADANRVRVGDVWSFTVAEALVIDDFEAYDPWDYRLSQAWRSRGSAEAHQDLEYYVFNSCQQAMSFYYLYDSTLHTKVVRVFDEPQDWTRSGIRVLELLFHGYPGNSTNGQMYVALCDGQAERIVPYQGRPAALAWPQWHAWRVALEDFNDIDLARVVSLSIGLRRIPDEPEGQGRGLIYFDDISLHPSFCPDDGGPLADLTGDCAVDYRDLEQMASDWLLPNLRLHPLVSPGEPILWYPFDGSANDSAGDAHGQIQGRPVYAPGVHGQAIHFMSEEDRVTIPEAATVFAGIEKAITVAFWQSGDDSSHLNDTVCCSNYVYGRSNPTIAIHLGLWQDPGQYRWDCGSPWSFDNRLAGRHQHKSEWAGRWNHWAFTKDVRVGPEGETGRMEIYLNGVLYDSRTGAGSPVANIASFEIGSGWYGRYDGLIDDFQIYDYALSGPEIAYLATNGTGIIEAPIPSDADLNATGRIDLHDFAVLANEWLQDALWP